jgi:N-methylhydantoinase B
MYSGYDKNGDWYQLYQITFGGIPGKPFGDGPDGHSLWPSFTNVPNEFLESYFPLRIDIYETLPDSGGPGKNRGGNGLRIGYRFLEPGEISIHDDRWLTYPWGVNGGLPGARSRKTLVRADGSEQLLESKLDHIKVEAGDLLLADTWGGGGCGDPLERETGKVHFDVEAGLVTVEGARRYGVVIRADGTVDGAATTALRKEMATARGPAQLFDRGFETIEELKSRCKAETGLEPPTAPQFTKWAKRIAEERKKGTKAA